MKKTIGILGGMGPEATALFYRYIIEHTDAEKDQDHIKVIIFSNPEIPPRTDAILKKGPDPTSRLVDGFRRLKDAGADFIVMPCVTAHYFYPRIREQVDHPFVNLLEESLDWARKEIPGLRKAGLISSTGTVNSRLFHDTFGREGIEVITPPPEEQEKVMEAIFGPQGIKAGRSTGFSRATILEAAAHLVSQGAQAIIAGCTEVPLVLSGKDISVPLIEPMLIAARACILKAGYRLKSG